MDVEVEGAQGAGVELDLADSVTPSPLLPEHSTHTIRSQYLPPHPTPPSAPHPPSGSSRVGLHALRLSPEAEGPVHGLRSKGRGRRAGARPVVFGRVFHGELVLGPDDREAAGRAAVDLQPRALDHRLRLGAHDRAPDRVQDVRGQREVLLRVLRLRQLCCVALHLLPTRLSLSPATPRGHAASATPTT
eukprot:1905728-Rhodomonas_salina.1